MQPVFAVLGIALMLLAIFDALVTTVSASTPAGPVTSRAARMLSGVARWLAVRVPASRQMTGPVVLLVTVSLWIGMLWLGWWLLLSSDAGAVVTSSDGTPASGWSRLYYASYTLFTLGNGEFVPSTDAWRVATSFATVSGLALVTTAITYLVPVVTAVTDRNTQAERIAGLGESAQAIVARAWDGEDVEALTSHLQALAGEVALTSQRHMAYPVLHFFHGRDRFAAFAVNVAALDEAVTIIQTALEPSRRPHPLHLGAWRHAVERLLDVIEGDFGQAADAPPTAPDLQRLRAAGIPLVAPDDVARALSEHADHRRRLAGFVADSGWSWSDAVAG